MTPAHHQLTIEQLIKTGCHPARGLSRTGDGIGARMTVEQLRTVVASLRTAVEFSRALAGAMPALSQLLASSTLTDVQVNCLATKPACADARQ